ncbi:MAG: hypothetical protein CHACPFDD_00795 [Phycisphaerae bacterium]|nr:hypothetical protein [Phycisphaerae bacterium]
MLTGRRTWVRLAVCVAAALTCHAGMADDSPRISKLNEAFLKRIGEPGAGDARAIATIRGEAARQGAGGLGEGFVPDGLAVLHERFRKALDSFEAEEYDESARLFGALAESDDPFVGANAAYYHARSLIERGLYEEAEEFLMRSVDPERDLAGLTPYAPHLWFFKGFAQASNLRFDVAAESLRRVVRDFGDGPEAVLIGAKQLLLEIERREIGSLDEVAGLMTYSAARLNVADGGERTRVRQEEAVKLLDKLIEEAEQREQQCKAGGSKQGKAPKQSPKKPRSESVAPAGQGTIGELHESGKADPGDMWGKLPELEREKILQSLRSRFPSRYRELVEQYHRALAEQK